jgi:hypothetical protein
MGYSAWLNNDRVKNSKNAVNTPPRRLTRINDLILFSLLGKHNAFRLETANVKDSLLEHLALIIHIRLSIAKEESKTPCKVIFTSVLPQLTRTLAHRKTEI